MSDATREPRPEDRSSDDRSSGERSSKDGPPKEAPCDETRRPWNPHLWEIRAFREAVWLVLGLLVLSVLLSLRFVLLPVFVAFLLAYLVNPLVTLCQRKLSWPRSLTVALLLLVLAAGLSALVVSLVPRLVDQLDQLITRLPTYVAELAERLEIDTTELEAQLEERTREYREKPEELLLLLWKGTGRVVDFVLGVVSRTTAWLILLPLVPFYFFFFAWRYHDIIRWFGSFVPASRRRRVFTIAHRMDRVVGAFFRERVFLSFLMGSLLAFGYFLVGVPYFVLLGIGTGILNFIPYAANIGWPLAVLLKYLEAPDAGFLAIAVWPTVVFQGVLLLEEFVLVPFVQRRGTNLSAVVIVIAVFIGGAVAGFLGLMFAIPIAACIKIFFEEVLGPRLRGWADSN